MVADEHVVFIICLAQVQGRFREIAQFQVRHPHYIVVGLQLARIVVTFHEYRDPLGVLDRGVQINHVGGQQPVPQPAIGLLQAVRVVGSDFLRDLHLQLVAAPDDFRRTVKAPGMKGRRGLARQRENLLGFNLVRGCSHRLDLVRHALEEIERCVHIAGMEVGESAVRGIGGLVFGLGDSNRSIESGQGVAVVTEEGDHVPLLELGLSQTGVGFSGKIVCL